MKSKEFKERYHGEEDRRTMMLDYMEERERIRLQKESGETKPWTDDPILQRFRFCNVFRYHDAVTKHYIDWVKPVEDNPALTIFNTMWYRIFNTPGTAEAIGLVKDQFVPGEMQRAVEKRMKKHKIFNPAYMITNAMSHQPKYLLAIDTFKEIWEDLNKLTADIMSNGSMEYATKRFSSFFMYGPFVSYEVATDLSYNILSGAPDILTWANLGPGAKRGLNRLHRRKLTKPVKERDALAKMHELMLWLQEEFSPSVEIRDVEHTLCEFDKWCRGHSGDGRPKQRYPGIT